MSRVRRANPGGEIAPDEIVGRDDLVRRIWSTLARQSVLMVAERRMGKTTVIKKMRHEPPEGFRVLFRDVESVGSPLEFAEAVAKDVQGLLPTASWAKTRLARVYEHIAGAEIGGVVKVPAALASHWKELLQASVASVAEAHPKDTYVFAWDELPYMLEKVRRGQGEDEAMDVLDVLRGLRQTHPNVRMIFSGSIGLHHVLTELRDGGHSSAPVNDMRTVEVGELDESAALTLATELIAGEGLGAPRSSPPPGRSANGSTGCPTTSTTSSPTCGIVGGRRPRPTWSAPSTTRSSTRMTPGTLCTTETAWTSTTRPTKSRWCSRCLTR